MIRSHKAVIWFNEVTKKDIPLVGGKGANLGEMTNAGIPVPPGFIVTASAYFDFIEKANLHDKIKSLLDPVDIQNSKQLQEVALKVQKLIIDAAMPPATAKEIAQAYVKMGKGLVAVRSSATAEDLPEASFAGQQATFLNVQGEKDVVKAVQDCWASLFGARAIFYRQEQGFEHFKVGIAVPVQRMVQSESSGVMFTIEPTTNDHEKLTIEAVLGLNDVVVSGDVTPDHYIVNKKTMRIVEKVVKRQEWKLVKRKDVSGKLNDIKITLNPEEQTRQKLSDNDIIFLATIGKTLEEHYDFPQDVEWAKEKGEFFIIYSYPLSIVKKTIEAYQKMPAPILVYGSPENHNMSLGFSEMNIWVFHFNINVLKPLIQKNESRLFRSQAVAQKSKKEPQPMTKWDVAKIVFQILVGLGTLIGMIIAVIRFAVL